MDLATATRQPIEIDLAGSKWLIKPRTLAELGPLQAWFKRSIPSPLVRAAEAIEQARRTHADISPAIEGLILDRANEAMLKWPPLVGSYHWRVAVDESGHVPYVIQFALAPCHPEITLERAKELDANALPGEIGTLASVLFYGRLPDPKDVTGTVTATPAPASETSPSPSPTTGPAGSGTSPDRATGPTG